MGQGRSQAGEGTWATRKDGDGFQTVLGSDYQPPFLLRLQGEGPPP